VSVGAPAGGHDPVEDLVEGVFETIGAPVDAFGVAATLESHGLRDLDAAERYGRRDVFELAREVYVLARERRPVEATWAQRPHVPRVPVRVFVGAYLQGAFSFLPLLLQVVFLTTLGYSQWGWVHFTLAQASTVALAAGLSMILTGAFVQVLGAIGPRFADAGKHILARRVVLGILAAGMACAGGAGGALVALAVATGLYSAHAMGVAIVYELLMSALWLLNGALYMLRRHHVMLISMVASTVLTGLVLGFTRWGIYAAHWLGLALGVAIELAWVLAVLGRRARGTSAEMRLARMTRRLLLAERSSPFAVYGLAYFGLLLLDRALAWSAGRHPLPLWFNVPYELGLDIALFAAALGLAFLECTIHAFTRLAWPRQDRFSALSCDLHNRWFVGFYLRQLLAVAALVLAGAVAMVGLLSAAHGILHSPSLAHLYHDAVTRRVFAFGVLGYGLLALGIANCGLLFVLGRPWLPVRAVLAGVGADLLAGLLLSRMVGFSYAAGGLVAGAGVYAAVSGWYAARALRRADYYLYAAV
jgi:hypothetical protein